MSTVQFNSRVTGTVTFTITEAEANALDALTGYGDDAFLKVFYQHLGEHYMKPHEAGLRAFFASVRQNVPGFISRMKQARAAFLKEGQ